MKASDLIKKTETAVALFTDGLNLEINTGGKSVSGVWRVRASLDVDKVIVYLRNKEKGVNEIYVGDFERLVPSTVKDLEHRFAVEFSATEYVGETDENWNGFAGTKRGAALPIKYIN